MSTARIGGAIVAVILILMLGWLAVGMLRNDPTVKPEVAVAAGTGVGGEVNARRVLANRSRLLDDRKDVGATRGEPVPIQETGRATLSFREGVGNPDATVRAWSLDEKGADLLRSPAYIEGRSSLPYRNADLLVQPQGRNWRSNHDLPVYYMGAWAILGISFLLALFLAIRGRVKIEEGPAGTTVPRFSFLERANHWMTAGSFIVLALTGIVIIYGKQLLLPLMSADAFGDLALASAWAHMASALPFAIGVVVMIALWIGQNIPTKLDWNWLKHGGGFLSDTGPNPPARRFNAGQKVVFWGVVLGGLAATASGVTLMFPFYWFGFDGMQWAQLIHASIGVLMVALIIGHIYIGTVGMQGAIDAMWSGRVDENWAKEHHSIWYREVKHDAAAPRSEKPEPAE